MRLRSLTMGILLTLTLGAQAKDYKYVSVKGDPMQTRIYTLDNGLKVYLSVNNEKPRIQTYIAVRTGSRNDPAETTGLAHYLEHLMFKGTKLFGTNDAAKEAPLLDDIQARYETYRRLTDPQQRKTAYHQIDSVSQIAAQYFIPNEYDKLMSAIGAKGTNAYTSNDVTCYVEDIPSNEVDNWAKIQADRFQNMVIRGFHTELEAVYEEYNIGLANDGRKVWAAFSKLLTPTHPYGTQTTIGTQEHLKNPSIVNIKNYFNRYYVPNNIAICMAGDFNPDEVIATIDKYFGMWKSNPNLTFPQFPAQAAITAPRDTMVVGQEAEKLMLGWRFDGASSLQSDTLDVIAEILSNGKAGLMDLDLDQKMKYLGGGAFSEQLADYGALILQGMPKEGQTLPEVQRLLLGEVNKLKHGDFSDDLIPSVINNMKLFYFKSLESNKSRASQFVDAFVNGKKWADVVDRMNRIACISKSQIVTFANKYLNDNYVCVYKKQGVDSTQKKIDKPAITPIPANRDMQSAFVKTVLDSKAKPIEPRFVDFNKDLTRTRTSKGLPVLYVQNKDNGLFALSFYFKFGQKVDRRLPIAADYFDFLGTDKLSAEQVKQQFYKLACSYYIQVGNQTTSIVISGLNENLPQALRLVENLIANAKVDRGAYQRYVSNMEKSRKDNKANQNANFTALSNYGIYGSYNPIRNVLSNQELKATDPQTLLDLIKGLRNYQHTVLYYGPYSTKELTAVIDKQHQTGKNLKPVPTGKDFINQVTSQDEILLAPYAAKNIYMVQYNNGNRAWKPEQQPLIDLFNEYFGKGMNAIVFQELRETRGLAYSAGASYITPWRKDLPEYANTFIITQNDKMMDCTKAFKQIIDTMPQSQKAFDLAKQALLKRIATERTTKFGIINKYLSAQNLGIDYDLNEKVYKVVPSLMLKDIVTFEKETMARKPYKYIILGDEKNLDIKALEKIGPIHRLSTDEIFGY